MQNVDSVAVFYEDRTYRHVDWDDVATLQGPLSKRIVQIHVYHCQSPGYPNQVVVNGYKEYCARRIDAGLIVRYGSMPPGEQEQSFELFFQKGSSYQSGQVEIEPKLCMSGMTMACQSMEQAGQYQALDDLASAVNLSEAAVPGAGTF